MHSLALKGLRFLGGLVLGPDLAIPMLKAATSTLGTCLAMKPETVHQSFRIAGFLLCAGIHQSFLRSLLPAGLQALQGGKPPMHFMHCSASCIQVPLDVAPWHQLHCAVVFGQDSEQPGPGLGAAVVPPEGTRCPAKQPRASPGCSSGLRGTLTSRLWSSALAVLSFFPGDTFAHPLSHTQSELGLRGIISARSQETILSLLPVHRSHASASRT